MSKVNVYHLRTKKIEKTVDGKVIQVGCKPYGTVAIEVNDDGTVNRGVAICSKRDAFVKKVGTMKAIGRLESAKKRKSNVREIPSFSSTERQILKEIGGEAEFANNNFKFLGSYHVAPTKNELELFKNHFKEKG